MAKIKLDELRGEIRKLIKEEKSNIKKITSAPSFWKKIVKEEMERMEEMEAIDENMLTEELDLNHFLIKPTSDSFAIFKEFSGEIGDSQGSRIEGSVQVTSNVDANKQNLVKFVETYFLDKVLTLTEDGVTLNDEMYQKGLKWLSGKMGGETIEVKFGGYIRLPHGVQPNRV